MSVQIRAVIFDWAGTIVDFGSLAPVAAFAEAFGEMRVPVSIEEIRAPMGLEKREHVRRMLCDAAIASRWLQVYGSIPTDADVDRVYRAFDRQLAALLPRYADPVPGALDVLASLRTRGMKIGSNSGYSKTQLDVVARAALERGLVPDCTVSTSEVHAGRPAPDLSFACLDRLGLARDCVAVKVDDTRSGIEEGRNAGLWTVAVALSGNETGLSFEEWSRLTPGRQERLRVRAYDRLRASHPDYVIDTVADLDSAITDIEARLASTLA